MQEQIDLPRLLINGTLFAFIVALGFLFTIHLKLHRIVTWPRLDHTGLFGDGWDHYIDSDIIAARCAEVSGGVALLQVLLRELEAGVDGEG